jgi:hypothetical protein
MIPKPLAWLLTLAILGLAGCSSTNVAEFVKAVGQDPNAYCLKFQIGTVYGTGSNFVGRGSPNTSVEITSEKCTITGSGMTNVNVPSSSVIVAPPGKP